MSITLNSLTLPQPQTVKEELMQIYHDRMTTAGTLLRMFFGVKYQATLTWNYLSPTDYANIVGIFTTGQLITYTNTTSTYGGGGTTSFRGYPMHSEGEYIKGASLLRSLTVVIRQN